MKRSTWVATEPPVLTMGGGSIRAAHLLSALAARSHASLILAGSLSGDPIAERLASVTELPPPDLGIPTTKTGRRARDLCAQPLDTIPQR